MGFIAQAKEMIFGKPTAPAPAPAMEGGARKGTKTAAKKKTATKKTVAKKKTAKK